MSHDKCTDSSDNLEPRQVVAPIQATRPTAGPTARRPANRIRHRLGPHWVLRLAPLPYRLAPGRSWLLPIRCRSCSKNLPSPRCCEGGSRRRRGTGSSCHCEGPRTTNPVCRLAHDTNYQGECGAQESVGIPCVPTYTLSASCNTFRKRLAKARATFTRHTIPQPYEETQSLQWRPALCPPQNQKWHQNIFPTCK